MAFINGDTDIHLLTNATLGHTSSSSSSAVVPYSISSNKAAIVGRY